ncbi:MAG TPA: CNNM domain-containing protein, partial [Solirubrobacteraceae bacterium]
MSGLKLILTALLIALNAFFVIAEYALVRSRRARLEPMREEGLRGAALALRQLDAINEYISAVQIGVTMTSIGIGALGEPALANLLKRALGGTIAHGIAVVISVVLAFVIITATQLIAGEMVPKFYAIDHAETVARRVARPLQAFSKLFRPLITLLTAVSGWILRL